MKGLTLIPMGVTNPTTNTVGVHHWVFMGQSNIGASIELTNVAVGSGVPAFAGGLIVGYRHYVDGQLKTVNMPQTWFSNAAFVQNCVQIKFGMGAKWATAHGLIRIVYF